MKCPKCGKDVELQKRQVGVDDNGMPVFNEYAVCRDCKKQWNLDKQRAKKAADSARAQTYGNIPPEKVRAKREKAMKQSYEEMLASDPRKKPVKSKRPTGGRDSAPNKKSSPSKSSASVKRPVSQSSGKSSVKEEKPKPHFKVLRIILGIISIIAFGFFTYKGFLAGLNNISAGNNSSSGLTYIILALCMLVSGLLLLIMRTKRTIFAFILPMIFYIGGAVCAFLRRGDDRWLLFGALFGILMAVIFLILAIASKSGNKNYDYDDDYDDPFEEDHENY